MARKRILSLAIVGAFILTSAGITQAGGWMHKSGGHEKSAKQDMGAVYAPEFGPGDLGEPIETGTLQNPPRSQQTEVVPDWFTVEPTPE